MMCYLQQLLTRCRPPNAKKPTKGRFSGVPGSETSPRPIDSLPGAGTAAARRRRAIFRFPAAPRHRADRFQKNRPDLFQDTLASPRSSYSAWLEKTVSQSTDTLMPGRSLSDKDASRLLRGVKEMLGQPVEEGISLEGSIPQQMVEDVFLRMVRSLVPEGKISDGRHPYEAFNALCHRVAVLLLQEMARGGGSVALLLPLRNSFIWPYCPDTSESI